MHNNPALIAPPSRAKAGQAAPQSIHHSSRLKGNNFRYRSSCRSSGKTIGGPLPPMRIKVLLELLLTFQMETKPKRLRWLTANQKADQLARSNFHTAISVPRWSLEKAATFLI